MQPNEDVSAFSHLDDPIDRLLAECLTLPGKEITAAFERICGEHPEHAEELRERMKALESAGLMVEDSSTFPERLGDFRLKERLGGGGMGVVYLAEQESLGRDVALKLIRPEHLYFPGAHERFRREADAIARLKHPGIVPIYTFGEEDGIPYFAMEAIEGCSLADLLRACRSISPERLSGSTLEEAMHRRLGSERGGETSGLFSGSWVETCFRIAAQVAAGLEHAHQHGVIHRDVKPSNIMLTPDGRVLLLDFGLALETGASKLTRTGSNPGSLAYMSPEQVRGERLTQSTDIYSLGVVLYEMLTLRDAFVGDSEESTRQLILQATPKPVRGLNRRVPWDAETVCSTAIAPERSQRYANMEALRKDLENVLSHRSIDARRPGVWLRTRRLVQRHPTASASVVLGFLLVVGGPTVLYLQALSAKAEITREKEVAERVQAFMVELFDVSSPEIALGVEVTARQILDRGAKRIGDELKEEPLVRAKLLQAIGATHLNLGLLAEADSLLVESWRILESHPDASLGYKAHIRESLGRLRHQQGQLAEAQTLLESSLAARRKENPGPHTYTAFTMRHLALVHKSRGNDTEARRLLDESVSMLRSIDTVRARRSLAAALNVVGAFINDRGHHSGAAPYFEEALAFYEAEFEGPHPGKINVHHNLAMAFQETGFMDGAELHFAKAIEQAEALYDKNHLIRADIKEHYVRLLVHHKRFGEARDALAEVIRIRKGILRAGHPRLARSYNDYASFKAKSGDLAGAHDLYLESCRDYRKAFPDGHFDLAVVLANLANSHSRRGESEQALKLARESLGMHEKLGHGKSPSLAAARREAAMAMTALGRAGEALDYIRQAQEEILNWYGKDVSNAVIAGVLRVHAFVLHTLNKGEESEEQALRAVAMFEKLEQQGTEDLALAYYDLGRAQVIQGKYPIAESALREAMENFDVSGHYQPSLKAYALNELGFALARQGKAEAAEGAFAEALDIRRKVLPAPHKDQAKSLINMASVSALRGKHDKALEFAHEALEQHRSLKKADDATLVQFLFVLMDIHERRGEPHKKIPLLRECLEIQRKGLTEKDPRRLWTAEALAREILAKTSAGSDELAEARGLLLDCFAAMGVGENPQHRKRLLSLLVHLFEKTGEEEKAAKYRKLRDAVAPKK